MDSFSDKTFIDYFNFLDYKNIPPCQPLSSEKTNIISNTPNPLETQIIKNENLIKILERLKKGEEDIRKDIHDEIRAKEIEKLVKKENQMDEDKNINFDILKKEIKALKTKKENKLKQLEGFKEKISIKNNLERNLIEEKNKYIVHDFDSRISIEKKKHLSLQSQLEKLIEEFVEKENLLEDLIQKNQMKTNDDQKFLVNLLLLKIENERLKILFTDLFEEREKLIDIINKLKDLNKIKN
jgi:hypothetical protein